MSKEIMKMIQGVSELKKQLEDVKNQELRILRQLSQIQHAVGRYGTLYGTCKKEITVSVVSCDPTDNRIITVKVGETVCFNDFPKSMNAIFTVDEGSWTYIEGTEEYFDFFFTKEDVDYVN